MVWPGGDQDRVDEVRGYDPVFCNVLTEYSQTVYRVSIGVSREIAFGLHIVT